LFHSIGPVRGNSMGLRGAKAHRNSTPNAAGERRPTQDDAEEAEKSLLGGPSVLLVC
jgi:hypothetical protein